MGHFFVKVLDKCMFLGQLSPHGSVRPVRGALSAAPGRARSRLEIRGRSRSKMRARRGRHLSEAIQYRTLDRSPWAQQLPSGELPFLYRNNSATLGLLLH
jgi:hypothetical protein